MEQLKITFIQGLQGVVIDEISKCDALRGKIFLIERNDDSLFFNFNMMSEADIEEVESDIIEDTDEEISTINVEIYAGLLSLKSIVNVFLVQRGEKLHPLHINNHKSILGDMIETVLSLEKEHAVRQIEKTASKGRIAPKEKSVSKEKSAFKTFKLRCAGSDSPEVQSIQRYISETFKLQALQVTSTAGSVINAETANPSLGVDLDMYIHKPDALWEVGVRLTPRPLSVRNYKIEHIKGGIDPTAAYAMNTFAFSHLLSHTPSPSSSHPIGQDTKVNFSYLNICSGSATLLIEARLQIASLQSTTTSADISGHFLGFDIDKKTNSQAIHNIQNAGLIRDIQIKTADLLDKPDFDDKGGKEVTQEGASEVKKESGKFDIITSDLPFGMQVGKNDDLDKLYKTFVEYSTDKLKEDGVLVVYTTEVDTFGKALRGSAFTIDKTVSLKLTTSVGSIIQPKIFVCSRK